MATDTTWNGGTNNTASSAGSWSNGIPTETSTVYFNNTACGGSCTLIIDIDLTVFAFIINGTTASSGDITISGATLTVTDVFTFGNPYQKADISIKLEKNGVLEFGDNCQATIYPIYSPQQAIYPGDNTDNWFVNKGTVTILGLVDGTKNSVYLGGSGSSSLNLKANSWGSWVASDPTANFIINYIAAFNIYGGSFLGSWIDDTTVSFKFYGTNVILQEGAGGDQTAGVNAVTFEYIEFGSSITQYTTYSDPAPNTVIFNTTGVTITNSQFKSHINVVFLADGTLENCNVTDYALVNSSSTVSGVTAYFVGDNVINGGIFAGIGTDFTIRIDKEASVSTPGGFSIFGSVTLINDGIWESTSSGTNYVYFDAKAIWVNLGVISVVSSSFYFQYSTFPTIDPPETKVGTIVNYGTVEFVSGGGLYYYSNSIGTFHQGKNGILKFEYGDSDSGTVQFAEAILYGWIGVYFTKDYTISSFGESFFTWKVPADDIPEGDLNYIANGPGLLGDLEQLVCFSKTSLTARVYEIEDLTTKIPPTCPTNEYQNLKDGNSNDNLPDKIKALEDQASCPATKGCGSIDTGVPAGGPSPAAGNVNVASLAFIVSLICLLFKF